MNEQINASELNHSETDILGPYHHTEDRPEAHSRLRMLRALCTSPLAPTTLEWLYVYLVREENCSSSGFDGTLRFLEVNGIATDPVLNWLASIGMETDGEFMTCILTDVVNHNEFAFLRLYLEELLADEMVDWSQSRKALKSRWSKWELPD